MKAHNIKHMPKLTLYEMANDVPVSDTKALNPQVMPTHAPPAGTEFAGSGF